MTIFTVKGMSCGHCANVITNAIKSLDPTASVAVDLARAQVEIDSVKPDSELAATINALDYWVVPD
ncbi:MAG: copper chaperone [Sphingobacteriaceae bacterium]|nr:MAG: copper chaperone [Sphingobacteriaceae bacterium]